VSTAQTGQRDPCERNFPENGPTGERDYLEATLDDIERANQLASKVLGRTLDSLMAQTRQLLVLLDDYVGQRCQREAKSRLELRFTQREIREALGWGDFQLRRHLRRLVELEYALVHRTKRGNQREYELLYDGQGRDGEPFVLGLIDVAFLACRVGQAESKRASVNQRNAH
jgi:DNA primase